MFNESFYPTPVPVIERMLEPFIKRTEIPEYANPRGWKEAAYTHAALSADKILEPSAGKGDIADYICEVFDSDRYGRHPKRLIDCIEIEPALRATLTGKGYRVIDSDFLCFDEPYHYDLIVMNPPFADGVKHLLKAWQIVADGGRVVCLLNAETVLNPYTNERELLSNIIREHGRYENIGPAFADAERPTEVDIAIVWLEKPAKEKTANFDGVRFESEEAPDERQFDANPLANKDTIISLVNQYRMARQLLQERSDLESKITFYVRGVRYEVNRSADGRGSDSRSLSEQAEELKAAFWRYLFDKTKVGNITTSQFQRDFESHVTATSNMAFNEANIYAVLEELFGNRESIMQRCIVEAFDRATSYHEKNQIHTEGWKTNKAYKLAPKIIHPWGISTDYMWHVPYGNGSEFYDDMDKALCFIRGVSFENIMATTTAMARICDLINHHGRRYDAEFESTYFKIRMYKKGTVHLTFKNLKLLEQFNIAAAKGKNWVGDGS